MRFKKAHCLFEQSGTFKNEFKALGITAEDYDILNSFGETDHVMDLFSEIERGYNGESSVFDSFTSDDVVMAFFPCTRFEGQILLGFRGELYQMSDWDKVRKLEYGMKLHKELHELYSLITKMAIIALRRNINMVLENPYSTQHYLQRYWSIKPNIIDHDRRVRGDFYKKPTQYWFLNFEPMHNFIFEPQVMHEGWATIENAHSNCDKAGGYRGRKPAR